MSRLSYEDMVFQLSNTLDSHGILVELYATIGIPN